MSTAIWSYDQFPYALAGKVNRIDMGLVYVEGYGHGFYESKVEILPEDETLRERLYSIRERYRIAQEELRSNWEHIAFREIPELINLSKWKEWEEISI